MTDTKWLSEDEREMWRLGPDDKDVEILFSRLAAERQKNVKFQLSLDIQNKKVRDLTKWFDKHESTPCEQIRHQHQVEALEAELAAERKKVDFFMHKKAEIISVYEAVVRNFTKLKAELAELESQLRNQQGECHTLRRHYLHEKACKEKLEKERSTPCRYCSRGWYEGSF